MEKLYGSARAEAEIHINAGNEFRMVERKPGWLSVNKKRELVIFTPYFCRIGEIEQPNFTFVDLT